MAGKKPKKTEVRHLPVILTDTEVRNFGEALAVAVRDHDVIEEEKKSSASTFKARIDSLEAEMRRFGRLVRDKKENRDVECLWVADFNGPGRMDLIRQDTGEVVDSREMTSEDRQIVIGSEN